MLNLFHKQSAYGFIKEYILWEKCELWKEWELKLKITSPPLFSKILINSDLRLVLNSLCNWGWSWTFYPLASTTKVVGLQYAQPWPVYAVVAQALLCARQILYQLSYTPIPNPNFCQIFWVIWALWYQDDWWLRQWNCDGHSSRGLLWICKGLLTETWRDRKVHFYPLFFLTSIYLLS